MTCVSRRMVCKWRRRASCSSAGTGADEGCSGSLSVSIESVVGSWAGVVREGDGKRGLDAGREVKPSWEEKRDLVSNIYRRCYLRKTGRTAKRGS